jgi:hypothetical protein
MMRCAFAFVITTSMLSASGSAEQQTTESRQLTETSAPIEVKFELLYSSWAGTLRLDKNSGEVWRLEGSGFTQGRRVWKSIPPPKDVERPSFVNFQLVSTSATAETLLLNVHGGATWVLRQHDREMEWVPITAEK